MFLKEALLLLAGLAAGSTVAAGSTPFWWSSAFIRA